MTFEEMKEFHGGELPPGQTLTPTEQANAKSKVRGKPSGRPPPANGKAGRWPVLNAFVDTVMPDLTRAEMAVWLALFRDTKQETGQARTGQADLARRCGCSVRAVQDAIGSLQEKGLLDVVRRGRINAGPSVYRAKLPG